MDNSDFQYEPPTKEFIETSLIYGLLPNSEGDLHAKSYSKVAYDYQDLRSIINRGNILQKWLIKFAYDHKREIKKTPWLRNLALSVKRYLITKYGLDLQSRAPHIDLSGIMNLEVNDFIWQLYLHALGRTPDNEGWKNTKYLLCSGASKEAIAYIICTSKEFASRAYVSNLDIYKKAYQRYQLHKGFRSLPLIGYLWSIAAAPKRIFRLEIDERMRYVDSQLVDRQRYEELTQGINSTKNSLESYVSELTEIRQEINNLLSQNKLLQLAIKELRTNVNNIYKTELAQNSVINHQDAEISKLVSKYPSSFEGIKESLASQKSAINNLNADISKFTEEYTAALAGTQESFEVAKQNITHANSKLDNLTTQITNVADQNRLTVYSMPGGITAVQTKEYIIGVPSEEWRLAVFLSKYGCFELGTEKYFRSILKEGMNVLDVGAYLGIYTLHALAAGCNVYSYEPTPKIFSILKDNVSINGFEPTQRAHLYNYAVADKEGSSKFGIVDNGLGQMNSLYAVKLASKNIIVKTIALDEHLSHLDRIDVAKIDVEGAEPLVLSGMRKIIQRSPDINILMEFAPSHLKRGGIEPLDFIHNIRSMGLEIRLIHEETGEITEIDDDALCAVFSVNVLLTKEKQ